MSYKDMFFVPLKKKPESCLLCNLSHFDKSEKAPTLYCDPEQRVCLDDKVPGWCPIVQGEYYSCFGNDGLLDRTLGQAGDEIEFALRLPWDSPLVTEED